MPFNEPIAESNGAGLRIGVAQPLVEPGDVAHNLAAMTPLVRQCAADGADAVLFSEAGITGYDFGDVGVRAAMSLDDPRLTMLDALAAEHALSIIAGLHERDGEALYNTLVAFGPDGHRAVQRKHNLTPYEINAGLSAGPAKRRMLDLGGRRAAMLICADAGMPGVYDTLASAGCELVLLATAGVGRAEEGFYQHELADPARRRAYLASQKTVGFTPRMLDVPLTYGMGVAACNQAGWAARSGYFHPGHSSVVDNRGRLSALIPGQFVFDHLRPQAAVGEAVVAVAVASGSSVGRAL